MRGGIICPRKVNFNQLCNRESQHTESCYGISLKKNGTAIKMTGSVERPLISKVEYLLTAKIGDAV